MDILTLIIVGLISLAVGTAAGFFGGRKIISKYVQDNTVLDENMVRMMFSQMGVKPNQKKINQVMKQLEKSKNTTTKN